MKHFCTAGPVKSDLHYLIPPLERLDRDEVLSLIDQQKYFVLHAPRQTGKTSCLLALVHELNKQGRYHAAYINVEGAQAARENQFDAIRAILSVLATEAAYRLNDPFPDQIRDEAIARSGPSDALREVLTKWAAQSPKPICLMIDEIDALIGDTLISVLRQLRSGYADRPSRFPQSIILCGVRDVRDYRIHGTKEIITGGSAFNVKATSLRLGDLSEDEVRSLYGQHTSQTGQAFEDGVFPLVWQLTRGQPWLVNALAEEACFAIRAGRDRSTPITTALINEAKEQIILRRETHIDQLADKLKEPRVRDIMQPILTNEETLETSESDDSQYLIDLGLLRRSAGRLEIANGIYREVIPRELNYNAQLSIASTQEPAWYIGRGGKLMMHTLLEAFQQLYRENAEIWLERFLYREAGPQLLLQAFLQRIVNGGGRIDREYGLGRRRTDLLIVWNYPGGTQRAVIEVKMLRGTIEKTLKEGLTQTKDYMDRVGSVEGHLVIFNPDHTAPPEGRIFQRAENEGGTAIQVWGM